MLRYGSSFCSVTRSPRALSSRPSDAAAIPLPREETTPPVTTTILAMSLRSRVRMVVVEFGPPARRHKHDTPPRCVRTPNGVQGPCASTELQTSTAAGPDRAGGRAWLGRCPRERFGGEHGSLRSGTLLAAILAARTLVANSARASCAQQPEFAQPSLRDPRSPPLHHERTRGSRARGPRLEVTRAAAHADTLPPARARTLDRAHPIAMKRRGAWGAERGPSKFRQLRPWTAGRNLRRVRSGQDGRDERTRAQRPHAPLRPFAEALLLAASGAV